MRQRGEFEMTANNFFKKFAKKGMTALAFCQFSGILKANGCGSPEPTAAVAPVMGGDSIKIFDDFIESVGRCFCTGVSVGASSTPAGSFFVPDVEVGGKSYKLTNRRLKCTNATTRSATDTQSPLLLSTLASWRLLARPGSNNSILSTL